MAKVKKEYVEVEVDVIETEVETEVEVEVENTELKNINDLLNEYNSFKKSDSDSASLKNKKYTLNSLDDINELVSNAVLQIDKFVGESDSLFNKTKSKTLSIFDPKSVWIGKWLNKAQENYNKEDIKSQTIDEIIKTVKEAIERKKEEVKESTYSAFDDRDVLSERLKFYKNILKDAKNTLNTLDDNSKDSFTAKLLINMVQTTIIDINNTIQDDINPLITSANIAIERIDAILPSIEAKLQDKLSIKAYQQQLSDLLNITSVVSQMTNLVDEKVTESIQATTIETMNLLKNSSIDTDRLQRKIQRDAAYRTKLETAINDVKKSVDNEFNKLSSLALENKNKSDINTQKFIESYSSRK